MKVSIVFSSRTGNTKLLAETIREMFPAEECLYFGAADEQALEAERIYVGFWTDKGTCDADTAAFLETIRDREVVLFGTAGFGGAPEYFARILSRVREHLDASVTVKGTYMCQGRMPMSVRERYVAMKAQPSPMPRLDELIENFDRALSHPDEADLAKLRETVQSL